MDLSHYMDYYVIGILVYSGLLVGRALIAIAPEEVEPGKKYFVLFQKVIFIVLLLIFALLIDNIYMRIFVILLMGVFLYRMQHHILHDNNSYLIYTFMGLFLGFAEMGQSYIFAAFTCFLFGLPTASLQYNLKGKNALMVYIRIAVVFFVFMTAGLVVKQYM